MTPLVTYASFGRRVWAFLLDLLIDLVVLLGLSVVVDDAHLAGLFAFWYLLHHVGLVTEGGALGHRLAGLRVVRQDGSRVPLARACIREVMRVISLLPLGLGMLWMLDDPERRTWHDLAAGTVVVRESRPLVPAAPAWGAEPPWLRGRKGGMTRPD